MGQVTRRKPDRNGLVAQRPCGGTGFREGRIVNWGNLVGMENESAWC
jgi:hypothetical protein